MNGVLNNLPATLLGTLLGGVGTAIILILKDYSNLRERVNRQSQFLFGAEDSQREGLEEDVNSLEERLNRMEKKVDSLEMMTHAVLESINGATINSDQINFDDNDD